MVVVVLDYNGARCCFAVCISFAGSTGFNLAAVLFCTMFFMVLHTMPRNKTCAYVYTFSYLMGIPQVAMAIGMLFTCIGTAFPGFYTIIWIATIVFAPGMLTIIYASFPRVFPLIIVWNVTSVIGFVLLIGFMYRKSMAKGGLVDPPALEPEGSVTREAVTENPLRPTWSVSATVKPAWPSDPR